MNRDGMGKPVTIAAVVLCFFVLLKLVLPGGDAGGGMQTAREKKLLKRIEHLQPAAQLVPQLNEEIQQLRLRAARGGTATKQIAGYTMHTGFFLDMGNDVLEAAMPTTVELAKDACDSEPQCVAFCFQNTARGIGAVYFKSRTAVTEGDAWTTYVKQD